MHEYMYACHYHMLTTNHRHHLGDDNQRKVKRKVVVYYIDQLYNHVHDPLVFQISIQDHHHLHSPRSLNISYIPKQILLHLLGLPMCVCVYVCVCMYLCA